MTGVLIGVAIMVALAVLWLALQSLQSRQKNEALESQMNELRRDLQTMATAQAKSTGQLEAIAKGVAQRLDSFTPALQEAVKNSAQITGQLATDAQARMTEELKNARDQISQIQRQLGEMHKAGVQLSQAAHTIEGILGGAKSRGSLGEITLERLLEDSLPSGLYATQYRFSSGEAADAVIFLRDKKLMAIDSKFPLDAYRRIATEGDEARRALATAVKGHADAIAKKYIVPEKFGILGTHLKNAAQSYGESDKLLEKTHDALQGMLAPAAAEPALENGQSQLGFTAKATAATAKKSA